ncbi:MAG TPA: hypothetical protein VEJ63_01315, partial [Planctomycetota bacterium]|nr:hypothetical protein [Planctomycetota bacterium]
MRKCLCLAVMSLFFGALPAEEAPLIKGPVYWFHVMNNTDNEATTAKVYDLMERAAKAGYTGLSLKDGRFIMKRFQTPEYKAKLKKFRERATEMKLTITACLAPLGYGQEMLMNDVNLAEGMPVRDAVFIVKNGKLMPHDPDVKILNGSLEEWKDKAPEHWSVDDLEKICFKEEATAGEGKLSLRMQDAGNSQHKRVRLYQKIKVQPWRQYFVTAKVKTENCTNADVRMMALGKHSLNWTPLPIKPTMEWTQMGVSFNSREFTEVTIFIGTWNGKTGR